MVRRLIGQVSEATTLHSSMPDHNDGSSDSSASGSSQYTPGSTPSAVMEPDQNPDFPLPSIEDLASSTATGSRDTTPDSTIFTPSLSSRASTVAAAPQSAHSSLDRDMVNMRIASLTPTASDSRPIAIRSPPETATSASRSPSIRVTPTPSVSALDPPRSRERTDSLVNGVAGLDMGLGQRLTDPNTAGRHLSADPASNPASQNSQRSSPSPSPSRRRRSGSGVPRTIHSVEDEDPPQSLFHLRGVQDALADARALTGRMMNVLSASALHREPGSTVESLYQRALRLHEFQPPSSRTVGLVGDSGVGKSRLINSLLDKRDLARASSANGSACTCVVTEYHHHDRNDFVINVEYFSRDELKVQFRELLRAFRDLTNHSQDIDQYERDAMKKKADLAIHTFQASFGARFENNQRLLLSRPLEDALAAIMGWTSEALPQQDQHSQMGSIQESFATVRECTERLGTLTSNSDSGTRAGSWPFIRKIRVYLRAHILSRGLILADLPGLRDLNTARQNVTERYVRDCHQIFAVVDIGRAITNAGVKEVFELARRARLSNVGIVCTRSDDIQASEARTAWSSERPTIDRLTTAINEAKREIEALEAELVEFSEGNLTQEEREEEIELHRERGRLQRLKRNHEYKLQKHIITVRNCNIRAALQDAYSDWADLKIFCVSNTLYDDHRNEQVEVALPFLSLSGIMELRRHCISIVSTCHLRATTQYMTNDIPAFLGSVELWVQAGSGNASAERKEKILDAVSTIETELEKLTYPNTRLNNISQSVVTKFNGQISMHMRQRAPQWSVDAGNAARCWSSWHHSSFAAFCRQYGTHSTGAAGYHCWNEEAMESMISDMDARWNNFKFDAESYLNRSRDFIEATFADICRVTNQTAASNREIRAAMRALITTLGNRRAILMYGMEDIILDFQRRTATLRTDAFSPIRTSIIGQLMEPSYRAANMEYGTGSDRRRKDIIIGGFRSRSLFDDHQRQFREKFRAVSEELQTKVTALIADHLIFVEADLNTLRDQNVVLESERNPEFRIRLAAEVESVRGEIEGVRRVVEDVASSAREDVHMTG